MINQASTLWSKFLCCSKVKSWWLPSTGPNMKYISLCGEILFGIASRASLYPLSPHLLGSHLSFMAYTFLPSYSRWSQYNWRVGSLGVKVRPSTSMHETITSQDESWRNVYTLRQPASISLKTSGWYMTQTCQNESKCHSSDYQFPSSEIEYRSPWIVRKCICCKSWPPSSL